ncbi:hypothetical protein AAX26_02023 [Aliarcobacter thereius]|uniref:hypothetical protein n=1 Tax=Aliarcobacter thereius TaxID=544718 RepID=UPI0008280CA5|nr:hypothetical protein [Aliarcobacter thereius]OCL85351.1 hypothetical protein AAX26_02023 [Aliarcobacter thereius]
MIALLNQNIYFKNSSFYKNISKDEDTPEKIIKVIHNKLKSEELKNILEAYNGIKNTNLQEYIIFSKNTLYMLCAPRLNIDEATQEELEQIVWNINSKDISKYNGKTKIEHNIKEEKVYKTIFNAYIKDNQSIESSANTSAVFDEEKIISNSNKNDNIVFYEAINREYKFTQKAYLLAEGVGIGGTFTIRGHINLNNDGELFVSASGFSAAKFSGNINYKMSIEVKINEQTIQKDTFSQKGEELWSNDNDFSPIGSIKLKLPNPKIDDIISLYLIATYTYSTGHGSAVPTTTINPFSKEASLGIKEIKLRIINNKIQKDKN